MLGLGREGAGSNPAPRPLPLASTLRSYIAPGAKNVNYWLRQPTEAQISTSEPGNRIPIRQHLRRFPVQGGGSMYMVTITCQVRRGVVYV